MGKESKGKKACNCTQAKEGKWAQYTPLLALVATIFCLVATCLVFGMRYQLNDDAIISNIASGAYGANTHYLVYVNVLLGWLFKPFYALLPGLNWFVVLQVAGAVLCFTVLGCLLVRRAGPAQGGMLFLLVLLLIGVDFFHVFHYVKYATLFLTTGLLLMAVNLGRWGRGLWGGMLLVLVGSFLRFNQFVAVGGLAACLLLWRFFCLNKPKKKRAALAVGGIIIVVFACKGVDTLAYRMDAEWASYYQFNAVRTEISDFKLQFGDEQTMAAMGYSVTDYEMLDTWNYYDAEVFSTADLQQVASSLPQNTLGATLRKSAQGAANMLFGAPIGFVFAAVVVAWLLLGRHKNWLAFGGTLFVLGAQVIYLNWRGRFPDTIEFSLVLAALVFCAALLQPKEELSGKGNWRWLGVACLLLVICSVPSFLQYKATANLYWENHLARQADYEALVQDDALLYLADVSTVDAANGYIVWQARPRGYFANVVFTGSWLMRSPFQEQVLADFGIDNLFADSLDRPDVVYLETVYRELKEEYLREHYNPRAKLVLVQEGAAIYIYRAVSAED